MNEEIDFEQELEEMKQRICSAFVVSPEDLLGGSCTAIAVGHSNRLEKFLDSIGLAGGFVEGVLHD